MSFAAGFATGFADTFVGRLEDRKERINDLVDQGIASAKAVAPRYMQAQGEYKNVLSIGDDLKARYGVTDEEFVALAQGTDIAQLYKNVTNEDQKRKGSGRSGLTKQDFINVIDMPEAVLPENMTREQALAQIMGLQTAALEKEDDPKSEGARTRSGGKALAEFLGFNPKLSAEKQLAAMKVMGYDVSDLEYFQATQGLKQDIIPGVTRTRDVLFDDIDYDKSSYDGTQRKFNSMFATRLAGADISDNDIFSSTTGIPTEDKTAMRDASVQAGMAMAKLELQIVNSGAGLGLIGPAARRNLMEGLYSQIDGGNAGIAELQKLMTNVENGSAINMINSTFQEKGRFDAADLDAIINGAPPETYTQEDTVETDSLEKAAEVDQQEETDNPLVARALANQRKKEESTTAAEAESAAKKEERQAIAKEDEIKSTADFIQAYDQDILDSLEAQGFVGDEDEEDFKQGLAAWFNENAEKLDIPSMTASADLDMLAKVFKQAFINLKD